MARPLWRFLGIAVVLRDRMRSAGKGSRTIGVSREVDLLDPSGVKKVFSFVYA